MRLEIYISQLLYRYPCVIIPGFGAFLTEIKSARLVEESHTFYPPYKSVSFNAHVINNDGLLANAVAIIERISFSEASKIIEKSVLEWQKIIQSTHKLSLEDVGSFTKNEEGNLVFEPYLFTNYYTGSFGLSSYVSPSVKRERIQKPEAILVKEPEMVEPMPLLLVPENKIPTLDTEAAPLIIEIVAKPKFVIVGDTLKTIAPKYPVQLPKKAKVVVLKKPKITSLVKYAAAIFIGATIAGTGIKIHNDNVVLETNLMAKAVKNKVSTTIQQATFSLNVPQVALPLPIKIEKAPFHVVASAYQDMENAESELEILKIAGFESKIIKEKGLHTVIYASFSSKEEANEFLKRIKKFYNPEAWLLTKDI